jgi:hypothetical protein
MVLDGFLKRFRYLPQLIVKANDALDSADPNYQQLRTYYNQAAPYLDLPPIREGNFRDVITSMVANFSARRSTATSLANSLNMAVSQTLLTGAPKERLHDTIMRNKNNPSLFAVQHYYDEVKENIPDTYEEKIDPISNIIDDIPKISERTIVEATNGGTIDVAHVWDVRTTAGGLWYHTAGDTGNTYTSASASAISIDVNLATTESLWCKFSHSNRGAGVFFHHDGTNDYAVNPSFSIEIPSGVPSGSLRIAGHRTYSPAVLFYNSGAGATLDLSGVFDTTGATLSVGDGSNHYWTWEDGSGNEGYMFHRRVAKGASSRTVIEVEFVLTATAPVDFGVYLEFDYRPDNVTLSQLQYLSVDISPMDPVSMAVDLFMRYDAYLADKGISGFVDILNARIDASVPLSAMYPQNWNTYSFDNFMVFFDEYVRVWDYMIDMMSRDIGFLETQ